MPYTPLSTKREGGEGEEEGGGGERGREGEEDSCH